MLFYILPLIFTLLVHWALPDVFINILDPVIDCPVEEGVDISDEQLGACLQTLFLIRFGFAYFILEIVILLLLTNNEKTIGKSFNEGFWIVKCIIIIVLTGFFFIVDNEFFKVVTEIAKYVCSIFVVMIIITVIDLLYKWAAHWRKIYDKGAEIWGVIMIVTTLFLYGMTIYLTAKNFDWFVSGEDDCSTNKVLIVLSAILMLACTITQFTGMNPDGSVLATSGVCLYIWWFTWAGMTYTKDPLCNDLTDSSKTFVVKLMFGIFLFVITIAVGYWGDPNAQSTANVQPAS